MVTKRTQDHVQETPKQPDKTIVSIEWLSSLWIDAANHNEVCNKYCNDLGRDSNLEFVLPFAIRVPLELSCQPKGDLVLQSQRPPVQILCYIYIRTNKYIYGYNEYLVFRFWEKNFGTRIPRPSIKTNGATENKQSKIELRMKTPKQYISSPKNFNLSYDQRCRTNNTYSNKNKNHVFLGTCWRYTL